MDEVKSNLKAPDEATQKLIETSDAFAPRGFVILQTNEKEKVPAQIGIMLENLNAGEVKCYRFIASEYLNFTSTLFQNVVELSQVSNDVEKS